MKIKKGTVVYLSQFGYYGYIYPVENKTITLLEDAIVLKRITWWIHDKDYTPFFIEYQGEKKTIWIKTEILKRCMTD